MQIYIARPDKTHGPYTLDEVNAHLQSGNLVGSDMAWFEGAAGWTALAGIAGVVLPANAPGSVPPPPPPTFPTAPPTAIPPTAPPTMPSMNPPSSPPGTVPVNVPYPPTNATPTNGDVEELIFEVRPSLWPEVWLAVLTFWACGGWAWMLPIRWMQNSGITYRLTNQRLSVRRGVVARNVEEAELYRVKDVTVQQGTVGRMLGFGDVVVQVNDASTPKVELRNVPHPERIKEQIRNGARSARRNEGIRSVEYLPAN